MDLDFNEILYSFEKKGGLLRSERNMAGFRSALEDYGLSDLGFRDRWFTWERGHYQATNIRERIEKGVTSIAWWNLFSGYLVEHLSHTLSDHCLILVYTCRNARSLNRCATRKFKFEFAWCLNQSLEVEIKNQ